MKLGLNTKPTKVWHFFHLLSCLTAMRFVKQHGQNTPQFGAFSRAVSQLLPQLKAKTPEPSSSPQWDCTGIPALQSCGLFQLPKTVRSVFFKGNCKDPARLCVLEIARWPQVCIVLLWECRRQCPGTGPCFFHAVSHWVICLLRKGKKWQRV